MSIIAHVTQSEGRALLQAAKLEDGAGGVKAEVVKALTALGVPHTVTEAKRSYNQQGRQVHRVSQGWPDITACWPKSGQLMAIECKRPVGGKLSFVQAACLDRLWRAGAIVVIARSVDDILQAVADGKTSTQAQQEIAQALQRGPGRIAKKSRQ